MKNPINKNTDSYLEERIKHLEGVERFVIDSLEVATSLGDFQNSINKLRDVTTILEETRIKVQGLIPFETVAFFLVDEESNDFTLQHIDSENHRSYIQNEVDNSIEDGIFAWALTEKRPVIVPTKDHQKSLFLHSMATATRIRGMFIGLMNYDVHGILNVSLSLVSLILFNSANAIESSELYRKIREINRSLERIDNYRLLFEAAPDGVEVVDTGGNIIDSNDSQKKLLGYSQEQLTGSLSSDYFSEKIRASLLNNPSSLNENGYWEGEVELVTATGGVVPVWRKEKAIYDNDHRFIGAVVYNRDITERKIAEEALRESESFNRDLVENLPEYIVVYGPDGNILYVNPATERALGYDAAKLVGTAVLSYVAPECRNVVTANMAARREKGDLSEYETVIITQDGLRRSVITKGTQIQYRDSPASLILLVDITERKREEEVNRSLVKRLQRAEKMEALGQLAGGVAHDLNNVLGILSGYSELLLMEIPEGSRSRGHVEKIFQSTEKGAAIIDDLLTLARRGVSVSDVINLNGVVSGFLKTPVFEKMRDYHPRVTFRTECDKNLLNINGSPVHLEKTLMNLVSNAAESISGEGEVTIRTESRYLDKAIRGYDEIKEGDYAVLTVSDMGMGIPAENREKIFEPFYTKKTMGRSGTGLGLAIVWGTIKDHNGYIDVQTEVGEGTTFTLYFPVTREEQIAPQQKEPIERYMGKGESVLVVDDIAEQRDIAARLLTRLGYEVHVASSGEEAVEYLKGNKADILVLDMIMAPGIDGLETYERVLEVNPKQKAILVSGFSETDRVKEAQNLGAGAYVKKPYVMEKIGVAIRDALNR